MALKVDTAHAPTYWASFLINGDASGMCQADWEAACAWQHELGDWYVVSCEGEPWIGRFDGVLCELIDYVLHKHA